MEIAANIHWIDRVRGNVYAVLGEDGVTLIDTGLASIDRVDLIFNYLERLKLYPADVRRILLTHGDPAHAGNARAIRDETGAAIFCSSETREALAAGRGPERPAGPLNRLRRSLRRFPPVAADGVEVLAAGRHELPLPRGLEVVPSPGHTAGHLAFFHRPTGVLFAGYALNTRRGGLKWTLKQPADEQQAYRSAVTLLRLAPAVFAGGHGRPIDRISFDALLNTQEIWLRRQQLGD